MNWHPDAYQALIAEDYPQVAAIYEELIDNNPENVWEHPSFAMSKNTQAISPLR